MAQPRLPERIVSGSRSPLTLEFCHVPVPQTRAVPLTTRLVPHAHAVGRLLDVDIVDHDSGQTLPTIYYQGNAWAPGTPGHRHAINIRNTGAGRRLAVLWVDGINAISGQTAAWNQTGHVFDAYLDARIDGWRKNLSEIAAFVFTALPDFYAARTNRPDSAFVIVVVVFREKPVPRPNVETPPMPEVHRDA